MEIIQQNQHIDFILDKYKSQIGKQFVAYKNHVYRVFNLIHSLSNCELNALEIEKLAIAAAFHDVGIWTHNTFDYLAPSIDLAKAYLIENNLEEHIEEVALIVSMHHKMSSYKGKFATNIELFRKSDWIDVSVSAFTFGVKRQTISTLNKAFPTNGFHRFLIKKTILNTLKSPFNPLPMFKR